MPDVLSQARAERLVKGGSEGGWETRKGGGNPDTMHYQTKELPPQHAMPRPQTQVTGAATGKG